ncbi:MAG: polyribonucleotide nucleotidyltransferase, partial [Gemmatimonadales bacterium]
FEGHLVENPSMPDLERSQLDLVVAGTRDSLNMVEAGAREVSEETLVEALSKAHQRIREVIAMIDELVAKVGRPDMQYPRVGVPAEIKEAVAALAAERIDRAFREADKAQREQQLAALRAEVMEQLTPQFPERSGDIGGAFDSVLKSAVRRAILEHGVRPDGRRTDEIRPIWCQVGVLPRAHGSAIFTRGQTQALSVVTLGTMSDRQKLDGLGLEDFKRYLHHYNFPPYSVGEARPLRSPGRREIGHGALAERALQPLLPAYDQFPYTLRVVSEILESNGSSSMATVCGGSLALMDAGVPMRAPCAGVAMGLIKEGKKIAILTDILGAEDHLGDMDFKVAGTEAGITSIQMDIKIEGLDLKIIAEALEKARKGRLHILGEMKKALPTHRADLSPHAPRIITIQIKTDKIGDVIGPKGKTIRGIQDTTGAKISIEDSGLVTIAAVGGEAGQKAKEMVMALVAEPEVGKIYEGPVKSTTAFGAFIEIMPGVEGLLHISELQHGRVEKTEDVVKKGDVVKVKLLEVDERGRMKLSRKALIPKE